MTRRTHTYAIRLAVEGGGQEGRARHRRPERRAEPKADRERGRARLGGLKGLGRQPELLRAGIRTLGGTLPGVATVGGQQIPIVELRT